MREFFETRLLISAWAGTHIQFVRTHCNNAVLSAHVRCAVFESGLQLLDAPWGNKRLVRPVGAASRSKRQKRATSCQEGVHRPPNMGKREVVSMAVTHRISAARMTRPRGALKINRCQLRHK